jgi:methanethiol S-methyltransferase
MSLEAMRQAMTFCPGLGQRRVSLRWLGIVFGIAVQAIFALTVWRLFLFLQSGGGQLGLVRSQFAGPWGWLWLDPLLAAQFGVIHSWLLLPKVSRKLQCWVPPALYASCFCLATCLGLLLTIELWQPKSVVVWECHGVYRWAVEGAFILGWVALIYSLSLTGLGYPTGLAPWLAWVRRRPLPRRNHQPRGAYHWLRHPVYLSFLSLVWLIPTLTLDRAVLIVVWTSYVFIGSYLKDRRLLHYQGNIYRRYQSQVPGYPFIWFGPLGKRRLKHADQHVMA